MSSSAGVSASEAGKVHGRRPPGSASPKSTSATARPPSWPGSQHQSSPGTDPAHERSIGDPATTATTVRGWTATTASISSTCRPGSSSDVRSRPSVSQSLSRPTTTSATSASAAAATARSKASGSSGGAHRSSAPSRICGSSLRATSSRATGSPATRSTASPAGAPSTVRVASPLVLILKRCGPEARGVNVAVARADQTSTRPSPDGSSRNTTRKSRGRSRLRTAPSAPRISTSTPTVPSDRRRSAPCSAGVPRLAVTPGSTTTPRPAARAGRRRSWPRRWASRGRCPRPG